MFSDADGFNRRFIVTVFDVIGEDKDETSHVQFSNKVKWTPLTHN
jgi:hypothetical protein